MNITKSQLKQIIKEELEATLNEGDWLSWLPDWIQNTGPEKETLYHGIDWFEKQNRSRQGDLLANAHRDKVPRGDYAGSFDKEGLNDWLWKYYVPRGFKGK